MKRTTIKSVAEEVDLNLIPDPNPPSTKAVADDTTDQDLPLIAEARDMIDTASTEATGVGQEMIKVDKREEVHREEVKRITTKSQQDKVQKKEEP